MLRTLLLPLNGSSFGEHVLPLALGLARRCQAKLHLLHVHTPLQAAYTEGALYDPDLDQQLRQREQAYLESLAKKITEVAAVEVTWANVQGEVSDMVRGQASSVGADLVLMTTHARGPMGRFWLGSTTDELLRDRPKPLLLVHPHEHPVDLTQEEAPRHFLLPLDGTALAEQILTPATALAEVLQARLSLLRVITPVVPLAVPQGVGTFGHIAAHVIDQVEQLHDQLRREAQAYLDGVAQRLRRQGLTVETVVAFDDSPGLGILHQAKEVGAELIAQTTHGRRGLARLFLGSVANKVLRGSHLPLLALRPVHG